MSNAECAENRSEPYTALSHAFERSRVKVEPSEFATSLKKMVCQQGPRITFCFCLVPTGEKFKKKFIEFVPEYPPSVVHCSEGGTVRLLRPLNKVLDLSINHYTTFLWGADEYTSKSNYSLLKKKIEPKIKKLFSEIVAQDLINRIVVIPFNNLKAPGIRSIFTAIHEISNNKSLNNYGIAVDFFEIHEENSEKIDFSSINAELVSNLSYESDLLAEAVFNQVWNSINSKLTEEHKEAMINIPNGRLVSIRQYIAKGFLSGGSRSSDRPWGIDKMAEECRKRMLSAIIREVAKPYSSKDLNLPHPDIFWKEEIKPYFDKFSLPINCLPYAAPALEKARRRHNGR